MFWSCGRANGHQDLEKTFPPVFTNLKQNEAQSARAESTHKGVNQRSKYVTQVNNKDLSRQRLLSPQMRVNTRYIKLHKKWATRVFVLLVSRISNAN